MKKLLLMSMLCIGCITVLGQSKTEPPLSAFKHGSETIGFSAGWGVRHNGYFTNAKAFPAIAVTFDRSAIETGFGTIGLGGMLGYKLAYYSYDNNVGDYAYWHNIIGAFRATYHITALKHTNNHFDPYAGIVLGARYATYENSFTDIQSFESTNSGFKFIGGAFVGAKYNFTRTFGLFAELGFDVSNFRIGINFNKHNK